MHHPLTDIQADFEINRPVSYLEKKLFQKTDGQTDGRTDERKSHGFSCGIKFIPRWYGECNMHFILYHRTSVSMYCLYIIKHVCIYFIHIIYPNMLLMNLMLSPFSLFPLSPYSNYFTILL